jgi:tetratricopeptide (TPR) repeat protein
LLKHDPANPELAEEAILAATAVAQRQKARSFQLRAALSLAKLRQSTGRPADAHAVLAPALEGFSPTPEMPENAEAQTLLAVLSETEEVKTTIAQLKRRHDLQMSYGQALFWGKGFAAEETATALANAALGGPLGKTSANFATYFARCMSQFTRGETRSARETAQAFLEEAEAERRTIEAGVARRTLGVILLFQGELRAARNVLTQVLNDHDLAGTADWRDAEVGASAFLALTEWHLGEVERARHLIDRATQRANETAHVLTAANALLLRTILESRRNDVVATLDAAETLLGLVGERGIRTFIDIGRIYVDWARARQLGPQAGASELRGALAKLNDEGHKLGSPSFHGLLAELEATTLGPDAALTLISEGLKIATKTGEHISDPALYRLRGDILLNRELPGVASAEDAYRTAITVAKEQGARSYQLLASLSLAKLYQSTDRLVDAYSVLAPALEGFTPTPEMPEIAEARALLGELSNPSVG